jgi:hypothetical protein
VKRAIGAHCKIQDFCGAFCYQHMMHKISISLLLVSVLACQAAFAGESDYDLKIRKAAGMPPEWFTCKVAGDCGVVPVPCALSLAVNGNHLSDAQNAIMKIFPNSGCNASMLDNSFAVCDEGQCVTRRPKGYSF